MPWKLLPAKENYSKYTSEWDLLNKKLFKNHPLLDSRFVNYLVKYFSLPNTQLAIYLNEEKKIESMMLIDINRFGKCSSFRPGQAPIAPALLASSNVLMDLFSTLPVTCFLVDLLCQDVDYTKIINEEHTHTHHHWTTINIDLRKSNFDDYWNSRSKNLRSNIKRYLNRIKNDPRELRFKIRVEEQEIIKAVASYGIIESTGWKGKTGSALHEDNKQGKFYAEMLRCFAVKRQARVYELYIDDELVSSRLTICNDDILVILKTTYNEDYSKFSPGRLLLYKLIIEEFELNKLSKVEFYTNATKDQKSWASDQREIKHITFYKNPLTKFIIENLRGVQKLIGRLK